jgi:plastocyanin
VTGRAAGAIAFLVMALGLVPAAAPAGATDLGGVRGRVRLAVDGAHLSGAQPVVVYLDAPDGRLYYPVPKDVPKISQKNATFSPSFLLITAGQSVEMPNDDTIFHNVFSYSRPNELDLGLYPKGASKTVTFHHPGAVRIYCSIHESMNALIYAAPSPYHQRIDSKGAFRLENVPPGRYRLRTWSPVLPEATREVTVARGQTAEVDVAIASQAPDASN